MKFHSKKLSIPVASSYGYFLVAKFHFKLFVFMAVGSAARAQWKQKQKLMYCTAEINNNSHHHSSNIIKIKFIQRKKMS